MHDELMRPTKTVSQLDSQLTSQPAEMSSSYRNKVVPGVWCLMPDVWCLVHSTHARSTDSTPKKPKKPKEPKAGSMLHGKWERWLFSFSFIDWQEERAGDRERERVDTKRERERERDSWRVVEKKKIYFFFGSWFGFISNRYWLDFGRVCRCSLLFFSISPGRCR